MWNLVNVVRELGHCVLLMIMTIGIALVSVGKTQEDQCLYYYVQQPSSLMACNPWPYMYYYSGNDLVLHCDVLGPQNDDTLSVAWYREVYSDRGPLVQRIYSRSNMYYYFEKFSTPRSSGDISHGFKRINFTLFVNNINEDDVGCYWCEIDVRSRNCLFHLRKSNVFCLDRWSTYRYRDSCSTLPVNSSVICAANKTCNDLPENFVGDPYLVVDGNKNKGSDLSAQVPTPSNSVPKNIWPQLLTSLEVRTTSLINSNTISSLKSPCTSQQPVSTYSTKISMTDSPISNPTLWTAEHVPNSKTVLSTSLTSRVLDHVLDLPPIVMSSDPNLIISSSTTTAFTEGTDDVTSTLSSPTVRPLGSKKRTDGTLAREVNLSPVHIGIFAGIGVCAVLFAVISMLVFGVVMLCRNSGPRNQQRNKGSGQHNMQSHGNREAFSGVWRREASPVVTSVVNTRHVIPPRSVPTYSNIPATINDEDNGRPYISYPLPIVLDTGSRWRTHSLPLLSERSSSINRGNQLQQNQYHVSLEGEIRHQQETASRSSFRPPRSPDLHYYHVLERPEYYNCLWTEGEGNGEVPLAEVDASNQKSVTIQADDSDNDSLYHWKVVLTSSTREEEPDLDRSSSSKRVGRHLYRRLDHSTMVPHQNYAKVSIGQQDFDGDESHV